MDESERAEANDEEPVPLPAEGDGALYVPDFSVGPAGVGPVTSTNPTGFPEVPAEPVPE
jgi:hypothetical protein